MIYASNTAPRKKARLMQDLKSYNRPDKILRTMWNAFLAGAGLGSIGSRYALNMKEESEFVHIRKTDRSGRTIDQKKVPKSSVDKWTKKGWELWENFELDELEEGFKDWVKKLVGADPATKKMIADLKARGANELWRIAKTDKDSMRRMYAKKIAGYKSMKDAIRGGDDTMMTFEEKEDLIRFKYFREANKYDLIESPVAKEILRQIKAIDRWALGAWGAKNLVAGENMLKFKTGGMVKWKGWVMIEYDYGKDLYNLKFYKIRGTKVNYTKEIDGVYAEDLVRLIDEVVG